MIGLAIHSALKDASYAADWVRDGQTALDTLSSQHYDLMLLDLGLPKADGFEVLRSVRNKSNPIPIVILTARDALEDRVLGLDNGADDYVIKPFELTELMARMRAVIRRKGGVASPILTNGLLTLDPSTHQVKREGWGNAQLTNREFSLLQAVMIRPGAILSRAELEDRRYGWGDEVESSAIECLIFSLRKKLGADAIKNVRGVGWLVSKQN